MQLLPLIQPLRVASPGPSPGRFGPASETESERQPGASATRPRVLVVDDESLIADSVAAILNRNGFEAIACYSGAAAVQYLGEHHPDIVVTDVMLPDLDGLQVAISARALCPNVRVVLFSGNTAAVDMADLAVMEGPSVELLSKPVHPSTLLKALRAA